MKPLILVKHSLPEIIATIPAHQWRLSSIGRDRCTALAAQLEPYAPDVIMSSGEPKARETAQIVAHQLNKPARAVEGLHEHKRAGVGLLDQARFESAVQHFFEEPDRLVFGEETALQALARFSTALAAIEAEYPDKMVVVVTHGTVMTLFIQQFNTIPAFSYWRKLGLPAMAVLSRPQHQLITTVENIE